MMTALDALLRAPCHRTTAPCRLMDGAIAGLAKRDHVLRTSDVSQPHAGQRHHRQTPGIETHPTVGGGAVSLPATILAAFTSNPFTKATDVANQPWLRQPIYYQHRSVAASTTSLNPATAVRTAKGLGSVNEAKQSHSRAAPSSRFMSARQDVN